MATPSNNIIDPHKAFANGQNVDIGDLNLFVNLTVSQRSANNIKTAPIIINLLGDNDNGYFTTDFTDDKENFGITKIDYKMTSSYVPQVDIEFMDVRGQSLFNDFTNSKYKVLFDFPPPIFTLTLKGYYGQSVTTELHLLKLSTSLNDNASFVIKGSFVSMTYAPLADILFDFLLVAPFLRKDANRNPNGTNVNTTYGLVKYSKDLISKLKTQTQTQVSTLNDLQLQKNGLQTLFDNAPYKNSFIKQINDIGQPEGGQNNPIFISQSQSNSDLVYINIKYFKNSDSFLFDTTNDVNNLKLDSANQMYQTLYTTLNNIAASFSKNQITGVNIPVLKTNLNDIDSSTVASNGYVNLTPNGINLTNIDGKIKNAIDALNVRLKTLTSDTSKTINSAVMRDLPNGPTLYTVLSILLQDALTFYQELSKVVLNVSNDNTRKNSTTATPFSEAVNIPFPKYYKTGLGNDANQKVLTIPPNNKWDEVQFVDKYINAKISEQQFADISNTFNRIVDTYIPINPFDSVIFNTNPVYSALKNTDVIDAIIRRGNVFLGETFLLSGFGYNDTSGGQGDSTERISVIQNYAKAEANNVYQILKNNPNVLDSFFDIVKNTINLATTPNLAITTALSSPLSQMTGASFNYIYSGSTDYVLLTKDDARWVNGTPTVLQSSSNDYVQGVQNSIYDNEFGTDKYSLSTDINIADKYNVPFSKDVDLENTSYPNFNSDYIKSSVNLTNFANLGLAPDNSGAIKLLYALVTTSSSGKEIVFNSQIYSPFDSKTDRFREIAAIHEIPFLTLVWWGYISTFIGSRVDINGNTVNGIDINGNNISSIYSSTGFNAYGENWNTISLDMQTLFKNCYTEYLTFYTSYFNNIVSDLNGGKDDSLYTKLSENRYLILGSTSILNPNITNKIIDYSKVQTNSQYNKYFATIKSELMNLKSLDDKVSKNNQSDTTTSIINNDLIRTELYYCFKSFVDRWMLGNNGLNMFEGATTADDIINKYFLLVDRGLNDIGKKVFLDLSPLYSNNTDADTSLYTLLLDLLIGNNFEFFAMPTFVGYGNGSNGLLWNQGNVQKIFGTNVISSNPTPNPKFICMYIGGTSAQLDMPDTFMSSKKDDGGNIGDIVDLSSNNNIQAFSIQFGTQNQSFFQKISLDQAEFKETNESIKILDKISKNNVSGGEVLPETVGNNLFNVYQQRSYTCTVSGLGNMMIQPTMYFQLENIAMFKGAYMIIEVDHSITPNNMTTSFKGVRIPRNPKPYCTDYSVIANIGAAIGVNTETLPNLDNTRPTTKAIKTSVQNNLGILKNPAITHNNYKALLDTIGYAEGTINQGTNNGYDIILSNKTIPSWSPIYSGGHNGQGSAKNPDIIRGPWWNPATGTGAAGRYQFLYSSWVSGNNNPAFNANNQDLAAIAKINERLQTNNLTIDNITSDNFIHYVHALSPEWDSFPYTGTDAGLSYYTFKHPTTVQQNNAPNTVSSLWSIYSTALAKYS